MCAALPCITIDSCACCTCALRCGEGDKVVGCVLNCYVLLLTPVRAVRVH